MSRTHRGSADRGSAMLLVIGLAAFSLLALAVLVDASAAYLERRQLMSLADAAALAGAQAIDLDAYYAHGASAITSLDPATVQARVRSHLRRSGAALLPGFALESVTCDGQQVRVQVSAPTRLPFLGSAFDTRITVASWARLSYLG